MNEAQFKWAARQLIRSIANGSKLERLSNTHRWSMDQVEIDSALPENLEAAGLIELTEESSARQRLQRKPQLYYQVTAKGAEYVGEAVP